MASFKHSFVTVSDERSASLIQAEEDENNGDIFEEFSGEAMMIEEITIVVRAGADQPDTKDGDHGVLATLDPLSQLLWIQALRHLH